MLTVYRDRHEQKGISVKLSLRNIAKVKQADIEINGITVIAGENNTGKSTVGRALFAVFNSFYDIENQVKEQREDSIENLLDRLYYTYNLDRNTVQRWNTAEMAWDILLHHTNDVKDYLLSYLGDMDFSEQTMERAVASIERVLKVKDSDFYSAVLDKRITAEFDDQVCNLYSEQTGEICLNIKGEKIIVHLTPDAETEVKLSGELSLNTEAIYLDDPFVLDEPRAVLGIFSSRYSDHRNHLRRKLFSPAKKENLVDEIIAKDRLNEIYNKLSSVFVGEIVRGKRSEVGYRKPDSDKVLSVHNLSMGLKTFVILKLLLEKGVIEQNGVVILDEPEIHLHPEWQLLFAELIVLIRREFEIHVLLNTHSPYFLNAIEVYSAKYGIADQCKYYLSSSDGVAARIEDVTNCIEKIYSKLAKPLQTLENERGRL